jgi:antitoxin (DNA-binding transcriptional repressor) of toxin-antitoxin stability system
METISMLDVRKNAKSLVGRLLRGESFRITYRNLPVGELFPTASRRSISSDDPVYRLAEHAEDLGGGLDARAADELIYR